MKKIYRSKRYLKFISEQPCLIRGTMPSVPHHAIGQKGTGIKSSDYCTVPLSTEMHDKVHRLGRDTFQDRYNVNFKDEIIELLSKYVYKMEQDNDLQ